MALNITDMTPQDIRLGSQGTLEWVRAKAIDQVLDEATEALKNKSNANYSLDSLELTINFLHQLFSVHHSEEYLKTVNYLYKIIDGKIKDPVRGMYLGTVDDKVGRKQKARWLMAWFGLIAKYLFPHEGIGDIKTGTMRRGFYEDKILVEFEQEEERRRRFAQVQYKKQLKKGVPVEKVRIVDA